MDLQVNVIKNTDQILVASFELAEERITYDPKSKSQADQWLDLTCNSLHLLPERIHINFSKVDPIILHHVKSWISYACKKYANETINNVFNLISRTIKLDNCETNEEVEEKIQRLVRSHMECKDTSPSSKSQLRSFYGWCVLEDLPFFDEDFYDLYLDVLKFGSDEGKGKDVIIEIPNRGPLTISELKRFKTSVAGLDTPFLTLQQLQGLIGLKIGQILGARNIQVIRLQFKHFGQSSDGSYYLDVPRAKQRGSQNNNVLKRRPITKSLGLLISDLRNKYNSSINEEISEDWFMICNLKSNKGPDCTSLPTGIRVTPHTYRSKRVAIEGKLELGFVVTNRRLRKTFCTQLIAKGTPLKVVAELMDHSDLQQLEVYYRHTHHIAKKLNDVLKEEASDIIDAFKGKVIKLEDVTQQGQQIFAPTKQQKLHLIGSCGSGSPCSLNPPLSCYSCSSLEAFEDADHKGVVESFVSQSKEVFGDKHAVEILQHDDYLAASRFVQMLENGEI